MLVVAGVIKVAVVISFPINKSKKDANVWIVAFSYFCLVVVVAGWMVVVLVFFLSFFFG